MNFPITMNGHGDPSISLTWHNFNEKVALAWRQSRRTPLYSDIKLILWNEQNRLCVFRAHKLILSSCSPILMQLIEEADCSNQAVTTLVMRGIQPTLMEALLDFMYAGEAAVIEEDLQSFLALAQELQIEGLLSHDDQLSSQEVERVDMAVAEVKQEVVDDTEAENEVVHNDDNSSRIEISNSSDKGDFVTMPLINRSPVELSSLQSSRASLPLTKSTSSKPVQFECKVCGRTVKHPRRHMLTQHMPQVRYKCLICGGHLRNRYGMQTHLSQVHMISGNHANLKEHSQVVDP